MDMAFNPHEVRTKAKTNDLTIPDQTPSLMQSIAMAMPRMLTSFPAIPYVSHHFLQDELGTTAQHHATTDTLMLAQTHEHLPIDAFEPTPIAPSLKPFLLEDAVDQALDAVNETRSLFNDGEDFEPHTSFDALPASFLDRVQVQASKTTSSFTPSCLYDPFNHCKDQLDDGPSLSIASKRPLSHNSTTTTSTQMLKRRRTDGEPSFRCYQEKQWTEQFQELIKFKEQKGHCIVPHTYPENQILSRWVKRQRYQYKLKMAGKASTMTDTRIKMLEDIAFVWDSHAAAWEKRFRELKQYHKEHGDCNVPSSYADNRELGVWIKCQRRQYKLFWSDNKSSSMTLERIQALNEIGFVWRKVRY